MMKHFVWCIVELNSPTLNPS